MVVNQIYWLVNVGLVVSIGMLCLVSKLGLVVKENISMWDELVMDVVFRILFFILPLPKIVWMSVCFLNGSCMKNANHRLVMFSVLFDVVNILFYFHYHRLWKKSNSLDHDEEQYETFI